MMRIVWVIGAAAGACALAPLSAQEAGSRQTREYVQAAAQSDAFEMLEAQTALTQSTDRQVHAFAQKMIADHARLDRSLQQAAAHAGMTVPPVGVGADQAPLLAALQGLNKEDFDKAYWRHQILAHRAALVTAQRYAANGDDPAIRQAASAALPVISSHLAAARQMVDSASGS